MSILVSALVIKSLYYVNGSKRGSRRNKIHPRGNPAVVRSIPAVFPQHSYPHPCPPLSVTNGQTDRQTSGTESPSDATGRDRSDLASAVVKAVASPNSLSSHQVISSHERRTEINPVSRTLRRQFVWIIGIEFEVWIEVHSVTNQ